MGYEPNNTIAGHLLPLAGDEMMDEFGAAQHLNVAVKTLRNLRWKGGGPRFVKLGRLVRYRRSSLDAFIDANTRSSTSEGAQ